MKIRIAGLSDDSIVDGEGIRFTIFTQGCPHHCVGCHNPETWDFSGGQEMDTTEIVEKIFKNPLLQGITLSGGDPFCQPKPLIEVCKAVREKGLDVWAFSGWTIEEILKDSSKNALLEQTDVLVDGRFVLEERDLSLLFRGSRNQRLIDVPRTLKEGKVVLWEPAN